jgi:hypothetical protein
MKAPPAAAAHLTNPHRVTTISNPCGSTALPAQAQSRGRRCCPPRAHVAGKRISRLGGLGPDLGPTRFLAACADQDALQVQRNRRLCDCHHVNKVSNELFFALSRTHARVPITGERRSSCALLCLSGWLSPRSLCPAALTIQAPGARTIAMEATTAASSPLGNARFRYRSSEASARDASDDVMLSASGRDVADAIANAPQPGTVYELAGSRRTETCCRRSVIISACDTLSFL